ncbi:MAG: excisionase family DNA-binding protein [Syntrophomonadaceae bacterium]|nr:excisionase family DNA-binding protein [Syntrophomonadaceae bacterium]MDD4549424.1 excisionase family DNA-binding protein [Syntrophomonadaceae bacterium]
MFCSECGTKAVDGAKFCHECGKKLSNPSIEGQYQKRTFTVKTALEEYFQGTLGETKLRELLRKGEIPHVRVGTRILIREEALDAWMEQKEKLR